MNERTTQQITEMKNQTIGIEVRPMSILWTKKLKVYATF